MAESILTTPLKPWSLIDPTLIGSDFNRYEVIKWHSHTSFTAWVKNPCKGMDGCDRCPGPHRPTNQACSQNNDRVPNVPSPGPDTGGIFLTELFTGRTWPGLWQITSQKQPRGRRSGIVCISC